jgi:hypothetical protein
MISSRFDIRLYGCTPFSSVSTQKPVENFALRFPPEIPESYLAC